MFCYVWHEVLGLVRGGKSRVYWKTRKEVRRSTVCKRRDRSCARLMNSWLYEKKYIFEKSIERTLLSVRYFRKKLAFYERFLLPFASCADSVRMQYTCNIVTTCSSLPPFLRVSHEPVSLGLVARKVLIEWAFALTCVVKWTEVGIYWVSHPAWGQLKRAFTAYAEETAACVLSNQLNGKLTTQSLFFYVRFHEPSSLNYNSIGC